MVARLPRTAWTRANSLSNCLRFEIYVIAANVCSDHQQVTRGEYFDDLSMLTKLMAVRQKPQAPGIEVIGGDDSLSDG